MHFLISGYYGFENTGDEAILEVLVANLKERYPNCSITVLSNRPLQNTKKLGVRAVHRFSFIEIRNALKKCNLFISGGGGLLQDKTSFRSFLYYAGLLHLAKLYGKPAAVFASGLGPFKSWRARLICRRVLEKVDLIILRDHFSYKLAKELVPKHKHLFEAGDLGALLKPAEDKKIEQIFEQENLQLNQHPLIGISVRKIPLHAIRREPLYRTIAKGLDLIYEKQKAELLFFVFQYPDDIDATLRVIHYLKSPYKIIFKELSPREILGLIKRLDLFIGMRLHSLVFSSIMDVPALGIAYDPKVSSFMQSLDLPFLNLKELKGTKIQTLLENLWENSTVVKEKLQVKQERLRIEAIFNFNLLENLLPLDQPFDVLGVKIHNLTENEFLEKVKAMLETKKPHYITTPNPEIIVRCQTDPSLKEIVNLADLNLADGAGLVVLSRFIDKPLKERLSGIDGFYGIIGLAEKEGYSVFLLGSEPGVSEAAAKKLSASYPKLKISGTHHGYFKDSEENQVISLVRAAKPDILFVGLGAPRQEKWVAKNYRELGATITMVIGGSLDVVSGKVQRAPEWIQSINMEWLYRLISNPWRWKRQIALLEFMFLIWDEMMRLRKEKKHGNKESNNLGLGSSRNQII
ncbi:MAG: polysaccharide pyruvyl transferase CsaB [Candidatus Saganbacteria bacterium]|nr:polysaccharide pyruvyl transferase CsaB [Candidatus Saganbacteria bacterium]